MDKEKARKLNRMIWQKRIRDGALFGIIAILGIGALAFYQFGNETVSSTEISGVVQSWSRAQDQSGSAGYMIQVVLDDGSIITASGNRHGEAPKIGAPINLRKLETRGGGTRYSRAD
ncbi:MAG: hypothetical protein ABJN26_08410 [Stappiaceae bacterium]